jgi:hypothetical protein
VKINPTVTVDFGSRWAGCQGRDPPKMLVRDYCSQNEQVQISRKADKMLGRSSSWQLEKDVVTIKTTSRAPVGEVLWGMATAMCEVRIVSHDRCYCET